MCMHILSRGKAVMNTCKPKAKQENTEYSLINAPGHCIFEKGGGHLFEGIL